MPLNKTCIFCGNNRITRHGRSSAGSIRFKCLECDKTWVQEAEFMPRNNIATLTQDYLHGETYRALGEKYNSTAKHLNKKIREYISNFPHWESYTDKTVEIYDSLQIILAGKSFSSAYAKEHNNTMFVAFAIDALSGFVLAYDLDFTDTREIWDRMLKRMQLRNIKCNHFMSSGTENIVEAVKKHFPNADSKILFHRTQREKELICCIGRIPVNFKLMNDAGRIIISLKNKNLLEELRIRNFRELIGFYITNQDKFTQKLKNNLENKSSAKTDLFITKFQQRFEKFYSLKVDPAPVINAWIANTMLFKNGQNFNHYSLYSQKNSALDLAKFAEGTSLNGESNIKNENIYADMLLDLSVRALELPVLSHDCGTKHENCYYL